MSAAYDNCVKIWPIDADLPLATLTDHQVLPVLRFYVGGLGRARLCTAGRMTTRRGSKSFGGGGGLTHTEPQRGRLWMA